MTDSSHDFQIALATAEGLVIDLDATVYSLSAVKKAAYKFAGRFQFQIQQPDERVIRVKLKSKEAMDDPMLQAGEFINEVLDQDLRESVAQETEGIRNLLLAQAFSATNLVDRHADGSPHEQDPLDIRGEAKQRDHAKSI